MSVRTADLKTYLEKKNSKHKHQNRENHYNNCMAPLPWNGHWKTCLRFPKLWLSPFKTSRRDASQNPTYAQPAHPIPGLDIKQHAHVAKICHKQSLWPAGTGQYHQRLLPSSLPSEGRAGSLQDGAKLPLRLEKPPWSDLTRQIGLGTHPAPTRKRDPPPMNTF